MGSSNTRIVSLPVTRFRNGTLIHGEDVVVRETTLTLILNGWELVTLVCSPGEFRELAVGFLCYEGVLQKREDLKSIEISEDEGLVRVETGQARPAEKLSGQFIASGCGRGRVSFHVTSDTSGVSPVNPCLTITPGEIFYLSNQLEKCSAIFQKTGGTHSAALCTAKEVVLFYEDVGRHNAVDKIYGRCFLEDIPLTDKLLVFSGRISSEILTKVAKMGLPLIISRSAPTELTANLAKELGITVVGFAREGRFTIYTHNERIVSETRKT